MLYLLDANVLIRAHEDYYPIDRVPQFWTWLLFMAESNRVKIPSEICREITIAKGPLKDWLMMPEAKRLILQDHIDPAILVRVVSERYAPDLNDSEFEQIGQDPFLIGYALPYGPNATVVTKEVSRPSKQRQNRKVPDVCKKFRVRCIGDFDLYRELNFHTMTI